MSEDEKLGEGLVGRDGRRQYDPSWKARLVAACLEPGVSVSRMALDHGINANLLRKWIKAVKEMGAAGSSARSAFIPVHVADAARSPALSSGVLDMLGTRGDERLRLQGMGPFASPMKVSASLPNGVKLTLECGDGSGLAAIIGALGDVQARR